MYQKKVNQSGECIGIVRVEDGAWFAPNDENPDYLIYLAWVSKGNAPSDDPDFTLASQKARKNDQINQWRLDANRSSFTHDGHEFACDDLSRSDIDGTAILVQMTGNFPHPWPGFWKAVDNSLYPITTKAQWDAFYTSMGAAGAANFSKSQTLKAALAAATTIQQVNAITW